MRVYTHPACLQHDPGTGHAERPARLTAVTQALREHHPTLDWHEAPEATRAQLARVHAPLLLERVLGSDIGASLRLDPDTVMSPDSPRAALRAAGAGVAAVDAVLSGQAQMAFCAVRPPGHHATHDEAMGFCLFNNIAVAAAHALQAHGLERVAILDFDVHHGNGSQDIFERESRVLFLSSHQSPLYPGTGAASETGVGNVHNEPLPPMSDGQALRAAWSGHLLPAAAAFRPQLLLVSAGFDAHRLDPLAQVQAEAGDFHWLGLRIGELARECAGGRVVSLLEGGYSLEALRECSVAWVSGLLQRAERALRWEAQAPARLEWAPCSSEGTVVRRTSLRLLPLCLAVSTAVQAQEAKPDWLLCHVPTTLPMFTDRDLTQATRVDATTDVEADALDVKDKERTIFSGKVQMLHGDQYLETDKVSFEHESQQFTTEGEVRYQDKAVRLTAARASGDQKTDKLVLDKVVYQFNQEIGNGAAGQAVMQGKIGTLTEATYSTCPPGQRQWEFEAGKITVNDETKTGVAHNVTLRLGKLPVLWLPVISFPTTNERRTGVLAPTLGRDDKNGLDLKLPVYLNLAPNYDATLTPRWLSKRGLMLGGEFRYLTEGSRGRFDGNWLPNDDIEHKDRSYLSFEDYTTLSRHWYFSTHLKDVSDRTYFGDFGDGIEATSISLLPSDIGVYGRGRYWSASLSAESWQIASPQVQDGDEPYRRLPRLQATAWRPFSRWFEAGVDFEAVRFDRSALDPANLGNALRYNSGDRVDLHPWLRARLGGASWFVIPQVSWRYTRYGSLEGNPVDLLGRPDSASRSVPVASLDAGAYFERNFGWHDHDYIQTLEPRLYYLRVPYREQTDLPIFDTRELTFSWNSLFRENRFGGADRQADANQVAVALTTRILRADDGSERLSAGLGRIHYFEPSRVRLLPTDPFPAGDGSPWIATLNLSLSDWWSLGVTHQWDPEGSSTDLSSVHTQLRFHKGTIVNAAYRYRRASLDQPALEQTDLSFVIPVDGNWNLYGRWNYSLHDNQTIEALGGFEWKSCCMAVRLLGRQYIRSFDSRENFGLYLEIELNGLGSFGRDTARLLDDAILGYAH